MRHVYHAKKLCMLVPLHTMLCMHCQKLCQDLAAFEGHQGREMPVPAASKNAMESQKYNKSEHATALLCTSIDGVKHCMQQQPAGILASSAWFCKHSSLNPQNPKYMHICVPHWKWTTKPNASSIDVI